MTRVPLAIGAMLSTFLVFTLTTCLVCGSLTEREEIDAEYDYSILVSPEYFNAYNGLDGYGIVWPVHTSAAAKDVRAMHEDKASNSSSMALATQLPPNYNHNALIQRHQVQREELSSASEETRKDLIRELAGLIKCPEEEAVWMAVYYLPLLDDGIQMLIPYGTMKASALAHFERKYGKRDGDAFLMALCEMVNYRSVNRALFEAVEIINNNDKLLANLQMLQRLTKSSRPLLKAINILRSMDAYALKSITPIGSAFFLKSELSSEDVKMIMRSGEEPKCFYNALLMMLDERDNEGAVDLAVRKLMVLSRRIRNQNPYMKMRIQSALRRND